LDIIKASWADIKLAIQHCDSVLLAGRPGTGKTTTAINILRHQLGYATYVMSLTEGDFAQSIFGRERLDGKGGMKFIPSPAILAMQAPKGALVLNEINRASLEVLSALYPICDVGPSAEFVLPNNDIQKVPSTFRVVATMNGSLEELPEGLRARFPVSFQVDEASPDVLQGLPEAIANAARHSCAADKNSGVRVWHAYVKLSKAVGQEKAAELLWGRDQAEAILDSIRIAEL